MHVNSVITIGQPVTFTRYSIILSLNIASVWRFLRWSRVFCFLTIMAICPHLQTSNRDKWRVLLSTAAEVNGGSLTFCYQAPLSNALKDRVAALIIRRAKRLSAISRTTKVPNWVSRSIFVTHNLCCRKGLGQPTFCPRERETPHPGHKDGTSLFVIQAECWSTKSTSIAVVGGIQELPRGAVNQYLLSYVFSTRPAVEHDRNTSGQTRPTIET